MLLICECLWSVESIHVADLWVSVWSVESVHVPAAVVSVDIYHHSLSAQFITRRSIALQPSP